MSTQQRQGYDSRGNTPLYIVTLAAILHPTKAFDLLKLVLKDKSIGPQQKVISGSKPIE